MRSMYSTSAGADKHNASKGEMDYECSFRNAARKVERRLNRGINKIPNVMRCGNVEMEVGTK